MKTGRLLVVDHDETNRSALGEYFTSYGYEVVAASDGEDALKKFFPGSFDCVISELIMPRIDGLELLKKIVPLDKDVFFLMMTAHPSVESAIEAMNRGAYDYVTKPFRMEDIRIKVEKVLDERRRAKSLKPVTPVPLTVE